MKDGAVSSRPDAMLDNEESRDAGIVASMGVANGMDEGSVRECVGGSAGVSSGALEEPLWWPEGVRGRRRVPLLGAGVRFMESQIMLYSSMFSNMSVSEWCLGKHIPKWGLI